MNINSLRQIAENFQKELEDSSRGKQTSISFIRNKIGGPQSLQEREVFEVLVIGGRVYKKALFRKENDIVTILSKERGMQPIFKTKEDLFAFLTGKVHADIAILALNFAYPLKQHGTLVSGSKENTFQGLVGKSIEKSIRDHFKSKRKKVIHVSVANDTICLLLAGLLKKPWNQLACGIVGAGLNFALFLDQHTAINLEAANFNKFPQTEEGKLVDASSSYPGKALIEKEVSGAYLYRHFNEIVKRKDIGTPEITETKQLSHIAKHGEPKTAQIASHLLQRSAQLVGALIAGMLRFHQRDLTFVMEGSLFWRGYRYEETVKETVRKLTFRYDAYFIRIPDSDIVGGAKLIL
ncbi:hypothetical protein HY358_01960 [Candidatus Roizmanbacteria bacterium]|nr:hypothetical protein [Candidatus Roizmanbacteria bacterium]